MSRFCFLLPMQEAFPGDPFSHSDLRYRGACMAPRLSGKGLCRRLLTLAWNANSETDLAGYRIFVRAEGESYNYTRA